MTPSPATPRLPVVLCWHMHQPDYRVGEPPAVAEPWTVLHGIGAYSDMAAHLEAVPGARAVVNFAPVLLDQIADLVAALDAGTASGEPLLDALRGLHRPASADARLELVALCLRVQRAPGSGSSPRLRALHAIARALVDGDADPAWIDDAFLRELLCAGFLDWIGEIRASSDVRIDRMRRHASAFDEADRNWLLTVVTAELRTLLPRWRHLAEHGVVELACSPRTHPILPLLIDFASAREALPDLPLPATPTCPHGTERARWHLVEGRRAFARHFGFEPAGCWPSEGALDDRSARLIGEAGFRWTASGMTVLRNSLAARGVRDAFMHRPFRIGSDGPACFFRDDGLSDRIGFEYAHWDPVRAVDDLLDHLLELRRLAAGAPDAVAVILLDGENPWRQYPGDGSAFLRRLYGALAGHDALALTTFSEHLDALGGAASASLEHLVAGSWVYGTLATWIGNGARNRLWDVLAELEQIHARAPRDLPVPRRRLLDRALAACEGSDWWWWAEHGKTERVTRFERLFARHARALCEAAAAPLPRSVQDLLDAPPVEADAGVMRSWRS